MYSILLFPILSGIITQIIKFFIKSNKQKFNFNNLLAYSGMPSGHTAMVVSLSTILGFKIGFDSPIFAISVIFAVIVIRDALGIRRYLGEHGRALNILIKDLEEDNFLDKKYPHQLEKIGHTPIQVIVGAIIGLTISLLGYFFV